MKSTVVCMTYRWAGSVHDAPVRPSEAAGKLRRWLALPQQRDILRGSVYENVGHDQEHFRLAKCIALARNRPWTDPPESLYEQFEQHSVSSGNSRKDRLGKAGPWFAKRETFSCSLHNSGFVTKDIHGDSFPEINKAIFVPDFDATVCISCTRPAVITHLEGRQQFAGYPEGAYSQKGPKVRMKGRELAKWHPLLRLTHPPNEPQSRPLQLCMRHANERVNAAIMVRLCTQLRRCSLPSEIGDRISHFVMYG